ncbi:MAG: Unknown protein [uncultured Thiotrichaceae bacterium]|uniref:WGR domain-containing protein n=1 Tax=uncultured Thiotrichaceae bacterium TaxID=298394 RepID=A0A6S6SAG7_9GAMM|nr:MAG: Unknown protein [uncultured Thiotrichaceae bacterium]
MYWIHEQDKKYYRARVACDLTGQLGVSKEFGSLKTARARRMFTPVSSRFAGAEELDKVNRDRIRHGYRVTLDPLEQLLKAESLNQ